MSQHNSVQPRRIAIKALAIAAGLSLGLLQATPAFAHAKLVGSDPAAEAVIASPKMIMLTFSQAVQPVEAKLTHVQTGTVSDLPAPMAQGAMLHYSLSGPLAAGKYELSYRVVTPDTHVAVGTISFSVAP